MTKHKPATLTEAEATVKRWNEARRAILEKKRITRAEQERRANAYPRLVEALRLVERASESYDVSTDKGRAALAREIEVHGFSIRALLRELGEDQ